jgi:hypothetical protein
MDHVPILPINFLLNFGHGILNLCRSALLKDLVYSGKLAISVCMPSKPVLCLSK